MTASMPVASAPILILDSGVGGLSVYTHIRRRVPDVSTLYLADSAGFPYGTKSEADILQRVVSLVEAASESFAPRLVVIACNTASTLVLPALRARLRIPVVGVVPAIKTAAAISKSRQIGLLATPGTIAREYTAQLIGSFAPDCRIVRVGSGELVHMAEAYIQGTAPDLADLRQLLQPFFTHAEAIDAIVLGCTHFPLLTEFLDQAVPQPVHWVDSGEAIARRVEHLLAQPEAATNQIVRPEGLASGLPYHLALYTQPYAETMLRGIQQFGFDEVRLFAH